MSSIVKKEWLWDIKSLKGGENVDGLNVNYWENEQDELNTLTTDSNGECSTIVVESIYTISNETDVETDNRTPHTISLLKYGLEFVTLNSNFTASKKDTFYMDDNDFISESDKSVVEGYTGIEIDNDNKVITITEDHTIEEVYDYTQSYLVDNPLKEYPTGIFKTTDGVNFTLVYDLVVDGCSFSGSGKYIDMSNNEYSRTNEASCNIKIKDVNGVSLVFEFTVNPSIDHYEYRIYKVDAKGSLKGAEELQGLEDATEDSYTYVYNYNDEDIVVAVQILPHQNDYVETVKYFVLSSNSQSVTIDLQTDFNN